MANTDGQILKELRMEPLIIEATGDTPLVNFNTQTNTFVIAEKSLPANAVEFYEPVIFWITEYLKNPNDNTYFDFKLDYFNTSSSKQIARLLKSMQDAQKKDKVTIRWFYEEDDTDMLESGMLYAKLIDLEFEFIEY
jgi:uncharacterized protein YegL